jgi:hypothetical protein
MSKLFVPVLILVTLAGCARTTVPMIGGYVPRDGNGRPIMSEIGKRFS